jgi:hypothetical protein
MTKDLTDSLRLITVPTTAQLQRASVTKKKRTRPISADLGRGQSWPAQHSRDSPPSLSPSRHPQRLDVLLFFEVASGIARILARLHHRGARGSTRVEHGVATSTDNESSLVKRIITQCNAVVVFLSACASLRPRRGGGGVWSGPPARVGANRAARNCRATPGWKVTRQERRGKRCRPSRQ